MNITGIFAVGLIVVGGMFYWYFDHSQKIIHQLEANNAKLELTVQSQTDAISALQLHARDQAAQVTELQTNLNTANSYRDTLEKKLRDHDLTMLARAKPQLVENRMNAATAAIWDDLETITGSIPTTPVTPTAPATGSTSHYKSLNDVNAQPIQ
jgi:3-oxoacyl-(acyl-carrier-protein) synthase